MMFHAEKSALGSPSAIVAKYGWMGVDIFFVLSGYLIAHQLFSQFTQQGRLNYSRFYMKRAFRVLPAFFVVVLIYYGVPSVREVTDMQPLWQFFSFTQNIFIDAEGGKAFSHAWSLCVEEHFYLLFPLVATLGLVKPSFAKTVFLFCLVIASGMLLRGLIWQAEILPVWDLRSGAGNLYQVYIEKIYYPSYTRLDGLCAGVLIAAVRVFRPQWWNSIMKANILILVLGIGGFVFSLYIFSDRRGLMATVIGYPLLSLSLAFITAALASENCLVNKLKWSAVSFVALISYSLYLTHKSVFHLLNQAGLAAVDNPILQLIFVTSASLMVAGLLYFAVERPFLILRARIITPHSATKSAVNLEQKQKVVND